jgi:hypothetical protein
MKIIVKGFERVNRARRKWYSVAVSPEAAGCAMGAPQCTQVVLADGVGLQQAGHSRNWGSLVVGFIVILEGDTSRVSYGRRTLR